MRAVGGTKLDVIGETEVAVTGAGPIRVLVTRNFPHAFLLGSNGLPQGNGIINYKDNFMQWHGREYELLE